MHAKATIARRFIAAETANSKARTALRQNAKTNAANMETAQQPAYALAILA